MSFKYRAKTDVTFHAPRLENPSEKKFYTLDEGEEIELPTELPSVYLRHLELVS